ncbi:hypothetical protein BKA69DRAFT_1056549 [Paraphysoderma sedebokerense]|nr:hypothetical protein BKA69DRAFT_1056549 [Paraphysoderma sedebokerense]
MSIYNNSNLPSSYSYLPIARNETRQHLSIRIPIDTTSQSTPSFIHCLIFNRFGKPSKVCRAAILLSVCLIAVNLAWLSYYKSKPVVSVPLQNVQPKLIQIEKDKINWHPPLSNIQDLVIVTGHGVFTGFNLLPDGIDISKDNTLDADKNRKIRSWLESERNWFLMPYQLNQSIPGTFLQHIEKGVELAKESTQSLLLFSGGHTREAAGARSEAQSYYQIAQVLRWLDSSLQDRTFTEEFARDSYENLLFSICRFKELTGHYPRNISLISYPHKHHRFLNLHLRAIRFPPNRFTFIGHPMPDSIPVGVDPYEPTKPAKLVYIWRWTRRQVVRWTSTMGAKLMR